jgi:hydroxypyruvate reductase
MIQFEKSVLKANPAIRRQILTVLQAALAAVDPYAAVRNALIIKNDTLLVSDRRYDLRKFRHIWLTGAGKAGAPMAQAVEDVLQARVSGGVVVVKDGHQAPTRQVQIVEASHPTPDARGVAASRRIAALAQQAGADDLVIALLSGGGSALLADPAVELTAPASSTTILHKAISLDDLQEMTRLLLACGAAIHEINTLRKHCSALKGGQLARLVYPASLLTFVLSDVVGSPLDVIASGPTVPDPSTWQDAWDVVLKYDLATALPNTIVRRLQAGLAGQAPDTPKAQDAVFAQAQTLIVGDNRIAAQAACAQAKAFGYQPLLLSTFLEGEAKEAARVIVGLAKEVQASGNPIAAPACLVLGGETTVTLSALTQPAAANRVETPGKGGRNQELALAAALALENSKGITLVSLATDGSDGPTDSAGAMADGESVQRGYLQGLNAFEHLRRHDAYPFLAASGDLLRSGPTQTNVNDLICVFVEESLPVRRLSSAKQAHRGDEPPVSTVVRALDRRRRGRASILPPRS